MRSILFALAALLLPLGVNATSLPYIDTTTEADGVVTLPDNVPALYSDIFGKYTKVVAANGHPIHILALEGVDDTIIAHAAAVMRHHLTEVEGSAYGKNKASVSNAMANNEAILAIFETNDQVEEIAGVGAFLDATNTQDVKEDQIYLEGTSDYLAQVEPGRNAAYEEVLHMVQDYGITPGKPNLQTALNDALADAIDEGIYTPLPDLEEESYDQEYFAIGMEAYYGFWAHDPSGDGKAGGEEYDFITRSSFAAGDSALYDIVTGYMPSRVQYLAQIDPDFTGTFTMVYDEDTVYTNRSQYLQDAKLRGSEDSNLTGNDAANALYGNSGDNSLTGNEGNDTIFGAQGTDTAVFSGNRADYTVTDTGCRVTVADAQTGRDGTDTLSGIESLEFSDTTISSGASNDGPVLVGIPNQNVKKGKTFDITLAASDQDNDAITYSATSSKAKVSASVSGTTLTLTPAKGFEGKTTVTVSATDGSCTDQQSFQLAVIGKFDPPAKEIADFEKDGRSVFVRYTDDREDEIRPFRNKKFRVAVSRNNKRLVVSNGKLVKVYKNGTKVAQKKIAKSVPKKLKHLRLKVVRIYKNYDSVVVASTKKQTGRVGVLRLTSANTLKKKATDRIADVAKQPVKIKRKKKRITVTTGDTVTTWKLTKKGKLQLR